MLKRIRYHFGFYRLDKPFAVSGLPRLSDSEKKLILETWKGVDIVGPLDFTWSRIYKKYKGFSPYYIGSLWNQEIDRKVNPTNQVVALENKALCDVYLSELSFPKPYVRCLNGVFFDSKMNPLGLEDAVDLLTHKESFVIKPSVDSMQGLGVKKVNSNETDIRTVLLETGKNFIAQETIRQVQEIESLNPSSLNCFRVTSMYFNGRFGYAVALKVGKKGATKDNWNSAYWIGVDQFGKLYEYGYDYRLNRVYQSDNGIQFAGFSIPSYDRLVSFVEEKHKKYFPHCGIIGWDITIDSEGAIRVIETNLKNPGTQIEELCSGPFLEPFRDDICRIMTAK